MSNQHLTFHHDKESGYILITVAIFLVILMGGSAQFFNRSTDTTRITTVVRDNSDALLLAESAMNMLLGRFSNTLDSNADGSPDYIDAGILQQNMSNPTGALMPYMFYSSTGTALDQTSPSLLQKIADGEALNSAAVVLASQTVQTTTAQLRPDALFVNITIRPLLYTTNSNGLLIASGAANWAAETNAEKASAWVEVTQNPTEPTAVDLYVQAMAQVGNSKSYLQRYVGSYFPSTTIGTISVLAEASNIDRRGP